MPHAASTDTVPESGRRGRLAREIAVALVIKIALLTGLWFAVFQPERKLARTIVPDAIFSPSPGVGKSNQFHNLSVPNEGVSP